MARGRPATPLGTHGDVSEPVQLPSGRWQVSTYLRLHSGKTVKVKASGKSETAATRALEQRCAERLAGEDAITLTTTSTLSALLAEWLPRHDVTDRSRTIYEKAIDKHINPKIGKLRLNELTTPALQAFLEGLTVGTARTSRAVLGSAVSFANRWGLMTNNPVRETKLPKRQRQEVNALTDAEMDAYRKAVEEWCETGTRGPKRGEGLLEIIDVLRGSGLRIGEALALRWQDVDLKAGTVTVRGTTDEKGGRKDLPKTSSSRRTIPVAAVALDALKRQAGKEHSTYGLEPVFPTRNGTYRTGVNVQSRLRDARGPLTIQPHDFRKTVATRIEAEFGMLAASRYLGHASTAVTEQAYLAAPAVVPDYTRAFDERAKKGLSNKRNSENSPTPDSTETGHDLEENRTAGMESTK